MKLPKNALAFCAVFLAGMVAAVVSERLSIAESLENAYSDSWHRAAGVRKIPSHVAIVTIDEASLLEFGDDPVAFWTRHHAKAVSNLRAVGVKAIGFDMLFVISPEAWVKKLLGAENEVSRRYDKPFRDEINSGKVVLAGARILQSQQEFDSFLLPHRDYLFSVPDLDFAAFIGLTNIGDGGDIVRNYVIKLPMRLKTESERDNVPQLTFAGLLAVRAAGLDPRSPSWSLAGKEHSADEIPRTIFYSGPPGAVQRVQYSAVVKAGAVDDPLVQSLRDKVVIVAAEYGGDQHGTPYSTGWFGQAAQFMSGPEIHANIVETLLSGVTREPTPGVYRIAVWFFVLVGCAIAFTVLRPVWSGAVLLVATSLCAALGYALFLENRFFPIAALHMGLAASYLASLVWHGFSESSQRRRILGRFGRHVGDVVVDKLASSGVEPDIEGESIPVTVMVFGIRNFDSIAEKLTPRETVEVVNRYYEDTVQVVLSEGGTVDKFIGDTVIAYFGAPAIMHDHAQRGMRAALSLMHTGTRFSAWFSASYPHLAQNSRGFGVGLHTGEAVVGQLGPRSSPEYSIIGKTVGIALDIAEYSKVTDGAVLATIGTILSGQAAVEYGEARSVAVRGQSHATEVFPILAWKSEHENKRD